MTPELAGLDYRAFLAWRAANGATLPHRLDGMDIVEGLPELDPASHFLDAPPAKRSMDAESIAIALVLSLLDLPRTCSAHVVPTTGVRPALSLVFQHAAATGATTVMLPSDVYPVYARLAQSAGLVVSAMPTLPAWDVESWLAQARKLGALLLLLPAPLVPLGRELTMDEGTYLAEWLAEDGRRRLVLDTVYRLRAGLAPVTARLFATGQVTLVHSVAKSHLAPQTLGVALMPEGDARAVRRQAPGIPEQALQRAIAIIGEDATPWGRALPGLVQAAVATRWRALEPLLQPLVPAWTPPAEGYYGVVPLPPDRLRAEQMLGIPASVFGSADQSITIVSCLSPLGVQCANLVR